MLLNESDVDLNQLVQMGFTFVCVPGTNTYKAKEHDFAIAKRQGFYAMNNAADAIKINEAYIEKAWGSEEQKDKLAFFAVRF